MFKPVTLVEALEKRALFSVSLDQSGLLSIAGTAGNDTLFFRRNDAEVVVSLNGTSTAFAASSIQSIAIGLGGGNDTASIDPRVIDVDTTVTTGSGADAVTVLGGPRHGELTLTGDNADTLTVTLDGVTDIIRLGDGTIVREGAFSLDPALVYSGFTTLTLIGGTQQDEIVIESVPAGMTVNIETGEGNDVVKIGDSDNGVVASIGSLINLRLGNGADEVNFDDAAATQSMSYYFHYDFDEQFRVYYYADRTGSDQVRLFDAETLRVYTSDAHDDQFTVDEQFAWGAMYIETGERAGDADRIEVNFVNQDGMDLLLNDVDPTLGKRRTYDFLDEGQSLTLIGYDDLDWTTMYVAVVGVDTNGNGAFDWSRDQALEGVLVYADSNANGRLDPGEPTATTSIYGSVEFYSHQAVNLSIVPPAGYTQVTPYLLNGSATPLSIPGQPSPGFVRFLYGTPFFLSPVPSSSEVRGRLFNDRNADRIFGTGDATLKGVSVSLDLNSNGSVDADDPTTVTDTEGRFSFSSVPQGEFAILTPESIDALVISNRQGMTSGFLRYNQDIEVAIAYAAVQAPGDISGFAYVPFYSEETGRTTRAIGVADLVVFLDTNENGARDTGERWTTTDAAGGYYFTAPGANTYRVGIELTSRYHGSASWRTVMVGPEAHAGEMNFRLVDDQATGSIRPNVRVHSTPTMLVGPKNGFFFLDLDENGVFSDDEPRASVGSGFSGLAYGSYRLNFVCPPLYGAYTGFEGGMLLNVGTTLLTPLFEIDRATGPTNFTIHVFNDTDHNGDYTKGESRLPFRVFIDIDGNGKRDAIDILAIPQPNGTHLFSNLPTGTYTFVVDADPGWIGSQPRDGTWASAIRVGHYSTEEYAYFLGYQATPTPTGSITGVVYFDADKDGLRDSGEAGIGGRTVWLDEDNDKIVDDFERVTTTASDGSYVFANLPDGIYKVRQIVPLGWQQTYPSNGYGVNVNVVGGQPVVAKPHGVYSATGPGGAATAAGWMFFDDDKDGVEDAGESRQAGKIVYIDANNNAKRDSGERQVTTNAQGEWSFTNLSPGTYIIRREVPTGYYVSTPAIQITLTADQVAAGLKIGTAQGKAPTTPPPPPPTDPTDPTAPVDPPTATGSISGYLFWDANANTIEDTTETRQGGKLVYLDLNNNGQKDSNEPSVTTNANGGFTFTNLAPRTYVVRRTIGSGYWVTTPLIQVNLNGQSVTNQKIGTAPGSGTQPPPVVDPTGPTDPVDPPPVDPPPAGSKGSISGFLFNDTDGDGIVDAGEGRASGRVVYIDANNNGKLDAGEKQTTTNTQGIYTFTGLEAGLYRVRRVFPTGYRQSTQALDIALTAGQVVDDARIGSTARVLISGQVAHADTSVGIASRRVYVDANGNGKFDSGEKNVFTDSSGTFAFFDLVAGTYKVRADVPTGWASTNATLATLTLSNGAAHTTTRFSQRPIA